MDTWEVCHETMARAIDMAKPLLQQMSYNGVVQEINGTDDFTIDLQRRGADMVLFQEPGKALFVEVKGANKTYKTAYIEVIADTRTGKLGWFYDIDSHLLIWVYLDTGRAHIIKVEPFKAWATGILDTYPSAHQKAYKQGNDTIGRLIPWKHIAWGIGPENFGTVYLDTGWDNKLNDMNLLPGEGYHLRCNNPGITGYNEYQGSYQN
jgi:hypothetical protein